MSVVALWLRLRKPSPWLIEGIFLDRFAPGEVRNHPPVGKDCSVAVVVVVALPRRSASGSRVKRSRSRCFRSVLR
ncbi:hypothetical protein V5799_024134 [Amblyomma americanum]|uniref:Uncharacterized protein n=1 Tax=Amblyomma americanum TaxID=6943 RepID=A0AAQ4ED98_AMBAM